MGLTEKMVLMFGRYKKKKKKKFQEGTFEFNSVALTWSAGQCRCAAPGESGKIRKENPPGNPQTTAKRRQSSMTFQSLAKPAAGNLERQLSAYK